MLENDRFRRVRGLFRPGFAVSTAEIALASVMTFGFVGASSYIGQQRGYHEGLEAGKQEGFDRAAAIYNPPPPTVGIENWVVGCPPGLWKMPRTFNFSLNPEDHRKDLYHKEYDKQELITPEAQQKLTMALHGTLIGQDQFFNSQLPQLLSSEDNFLVQETGWHNSYEVTTSNPSYENNGKVCIPAPGGHYPSIQLLQYRDYSTHLPTVEELSVNLDENGLSLKKADSNFTLADLNVLARTHLVQGIPWEEVDEGRRLIAVERDDIIVEGHPAHRLIAHSLYSSGRYQRETEFTYADQ